MLASTIKSQGLMNTDYSRGYLCACSISKAVDIIQYYKAYSTISANKNEEVHGSSSSTTTSTSTNTRGDVVLSQIATLLGKLQNLVGKLEIQAR